MTKFLGCAINELIIFKKEKQKKIKIKEKKKSEDKFEVTNIDITHIQFRVHEIDLGFCSAKREFLALPSDYFIQFKFFEKHKLLNTSST